VKIYDNYILILASLLLSTSVILTVLNETRIDLCFSIFLIETLVLNELCICFNPKAKRNLNRVNYILFAGSSFIVAAKVTEIIWGINAVEALQALSR